MSYIPEALRNLVRERAKGCCEYCLINQKYTVKRHEIDHIRAEKHGGRTVASNLCLSCYDCNHNKGSDLSSIDPETEEGAFLFHPGLDKWSDHFALEGQIIKPLTSKGRVTVFLLRFNDPIRVLEREILIKQERYP
jgi:hypothetical protein